MPTEKIIVLLTIAMVLSCTTVRVDPEIQPTSASSERTAKNIILLIGDGMGLTQISAGTFASSNRSHFERMKTVGIHKPYASNSLITDSAAGATAISCGVKTYNNAIGVDADTIAVKTILEEAEERGLKTGLISTSSITHATPASFIAHDPYRRNMEAIAADFMDTDIDIFIGGGKNYFVNRSTDDRDLYQELRDRGYLVEDFFEKEITEVNIPSPQPYVYLTSNEEPLPVRQGRDYLPHAVAITLDHLNTNNDNGFFLMIEGSQIDWGGHANDLDYVLTEWKEFNQVLGHVLDWAHMDANTLVIVTADHETGGLAIQVESKMDSLVAAFTSSYHTATMIPVFAHGPGCDNFSGIYENTDIYHYMRQAFGWQEIAQ